MPDILERLQPVFRDVLDSPTLVVTRGSSGLNVPGWDSLAHITLVSETEREFGIRFALGELETLKNVGDMVDLIQQKIGA
ncbi:MAG TPA: acyl carrier protein [Gemmatimonadaceae bacterium]